MIDERASRLDASIKAMAEYFPDFSLSGSPIGTGPEAVWKGTVQPIRGTENLIELLDDLYHERPVMMWAGGIIDHRPDCAAEHCRHEWMMKVSNPFADYKLEVRYGGGEAHPRAYVRHPVVPLLERRKHHFEDGALCAYPAWHDVWRWDRDTVVNFMSHVVEWLVKWMVWKQSRVWLGAEKGHAPSMLLREIRPDRQCHCNSGKQYGVCHRSIDQAALIQ